MEYSQIIYETADRIATIQFNRPEELNALSPVMYSELVDALKKADDDDDIRVIIITGTGTSFCAGLDLSKKNKEMKQHSEIAHNDVQEKTDLAGMTTLTIYNLKKPVIAAINGPAIV